MIGELVLYGLGVAALVVTVVLAVLRGVPRLYTLLATRPEGEEVHRVSWHRVNYRLLITPYQVRLTTSAPPMLLVAAAGTFALFWLVLGYHVMHPLLQALMPWRGLWSPMQVGPMSWAGGAIVLLLFFLCIAGWFERCTLLLEERGDLWVHRQGLLRSEEQSVPVDQIVAVDVTEDGMRAQLCTSETTIHLFSINSPKPFPAEIAQDMARLSEGLLRLAGDRRSAEDPLDPPEEEADAPAPPAPRPEAAEQAPPPE